MSPLKRASAAAVVAFAALALAGCSTSSAVAQAAEKDEVVAAAWSSVQARLGDGNDTAACEEIWKTPVQNGITIDESVEPAVKKDNYAGASGDSWTVKFAKKVEGDEPLGDAFAEGAEKRWAAIYIEQTEDNKLCSGAAYGLDG